MAARYIEFDEGLGGSWWEFVPDSEGYAVTGTGATKEQAEADAARKVAARNEFLAQAPETQLRALVDQKELSHFDMNRAIRLLAQIILQ